MSNSRGGGKEGKGRGGRGEKVTTKGRLHWADWRQFDTGHGGTSSEKSRRLKMH